MQVTVKLRYLRHSAKKLRPVGRLLVGKNLETALNQTAVMSQDSARYLHQALLMAKAAAEQKELGAEKATISAIMATEGPKIKRMRPNSRGRSNAYLKHIAHLNVTVSDEAPKVKAKPAAKVRTTKKETK
ncbi:MAG TPA: uL22 family ribosomal protein [Candidatus Saccharimonadales bacterium]|nr:uL22 family ribosomal protein [Candidatus Saccharimonadales bacterium]